MNRKIKQIIELEAILLGTIVKRHGPCGKEGCRCAKGIKYWHGPYYIWTRKENGKTVTKSLSKEQVAFCKQAIKNMKKLQLIITKWKEVSIRKMLNIT